MPPRQSEGPRRESPPLSSPPGRRRDRSDRDFWNERHAGKVAGSPVDWLTAHRDLLAAQPRGPALDVGCGLGRHAMMLAGMGFTVDALDVSDTALESLDTQARRRGRAIRPKRVDLRTGDWRPERSYQVVVDTYFLERSLFRRLVDALAPGGLLFFETFMEGQPDCNARYLLAPGELRPAFSGLEILDAREGSVDDRRVLSSLVARKPRVARAST